MDKKGGSELRSNKTEADGKVNPEEKEAGNDREDYGLWMLAEHRKHASKSRTNHSQSFKSNLEQIKTFNAKDLGWLRRLTAEANPPTRPPTVSPEGKRKNRRLDNTSKLDPTTSLNQEPTATEISQGALLVHSISLWFRRKRILRLFQTYLGQNPRHLTQKQTTISNPQQKKLRLAIGDNSLRQWAISLHEKIMPLSMSFIQQIQASPTMI